MITPENALQKEIIVRVLEGSWCEELQAYLRGADLSVSQESIASSDDGEIIDSVYGLLLMGDWTQDYTEELKSSGERTSVKAEWNPMERHYEAEERAVKTQHGWVGYTYWSGGGKHGEPSGVPWMEDAYWLDCQEQEKTVTVRTFKKSADL